MRGFKVLRKAGWDTHGLPVELEIEKKLGLKSKKDIERYGIASFNKLCKESVWHYKKDWEKLTERIAFWLDMENPYITYTPDYIETVWWILKQIHQKGLLYQDYKVVPYCPRCVDGNSKILTNPGLSKSIKELKNCWKENKVVAFDARNNRITTASINEFIALQKESTLKLSTVETQRSIIATGDHPFWVKGKGWKPLEKINIGEKVAVYPYFEVSEDKSKNKKVLNEKELQDIITNLEVKRGKKRIRKDIIDYRNLITTDKWKIDKQIRVFRERGNGFRKIRKKILSKLKVKAAINTIRSACQKKTRVRSRTLEYVMHELRNKNLLPLTTKNPKLLIIARLLGHIFGDGYLEITSGKRISLILGFTGEKEDLDEIRKDLEVLGFSYEPITRRFAKSILKDRTIQGYTIAFRVNSTALAALLMALGAPVREKSKTYFEIPRWLFGAPKHIIREFLAAYFGSEMSKIRILSKRGFEPLKFYLSKDEKLIKNGQNFIKQISQLLKKFNVKIRRIRLGPKFSRKDGGTSVKITAIFDGSKENLLNFCRFVGYRYSKDRESFALYVREYLETRKILEKEKIRKYKTILKLKDKGLNPKEISQTLNIKTERINEILNRKSKKDIRIWNIPEFKNWFRNATEGFSEGIVWETVGKIEKIGKRDVFDFNVDNLHSFIVNGFITHNCGTSLSSHEVALGYEKIREPAIYIKFEIRNPKFETRGRSYLLVWTTTPWTLPGNVAIAANPEFVYVEAKVNDEYLILAKERLNVLGGNYEVIKKFKGKDLVGLRYNGLYPPDEEISKIAYKVIPADFVSLEEGTGLVHIAPAFGEEDMETGKENDLPILLNVGEEGKFTLDVKKWAGLYVKDADPLIIEDLKQRKLLFKEEKYLHDYPFCWRCDSPLLYYAKQSWFINMQKVKRDLIKNNRKINWTPAHLKEGRFGEWLEEIKDWALSRERFWGTPLPIWQCKKCGNLEMIGSQKDLVSQNFSKNKYYILRHGETIYQTEKKKMMYPWPESEPVLLTKNGETQIKKIAKKLKNKKIDLIYSSDSSRTRQTAEIVAIELGVKLFLDKRLRDINLGIYHGGEKAKFYQDFPDLEERFLKAPRKGESWSNCRERMVNFLKEIDKKHQNKNILLVSHGDPLWLLEGAMMGWQNKEYLKKTTKANFIKVGELKKIEFKNLPFNEKGELDFHRPYIDEVKFFCPRCESLMERVSEVIDCWFDSGAMPFAQYHFPFENKNLIDKRQQFPADYISEAVDQTRGWFYTLLAISTLLGFGTPYKNVISLGHVLDEKGGKMSKSKGNVVDPWKVVEKYGADVTRWYFFTVNQPGDAKLFSERDVDQALKKFILTFWNCFVFYNTYAEQRGKKHKDISGNQRSYQRKSAVLLDRWIISRLNNLIKETTQRLDKYDVTGTARAIENFIIEDLSLWYIRRSRRRFQKPETEKELKEASGTLNYVLLTLSKLTAPFIPFLSDEIYRNLIETRPLLSVHLESWPKVNKKLIDKKLEKKMEKAREVVALALAERAKVGIKVRQPLAKLQIANGKLKIEKELLDLIKEEVNVKEITFDKTLKLDTEITPELKEEGIIREVIRQIQEMRKKAKFKPKDKILVNYFGTAELNKILEKNKEFLLKEANLRDLTLKEKAKKELFAGEKEILVDQAKLWLAIKKI